MEIQDIKEYFDKFQCDVLTKSDVDDDEIQKFSSTARRTDLECFFKEKAFKTDLDGETRVYVVRDPNTWQIVLYFSIKCGLVFTTYESDDQFMELTDVEKAYVNILTGYRKEGVDEGYYEAIKSGEKLFGEKVHDLAAIAEHQVNIQSSESQTDDKRTSRNVQECFSAIEIKHFCKNEAYRVKPEIQYPLGFGIFWRKVVPLIEEISQKIGCEYLYLFAADTSENQGEHKLINYYKESLGFYSLEDEGLVILKPDYDLNCLGMVQHISCLSKRGEAIWESFSDLAQ